ncbi:MAG: hypothetical protein AAF628_15170 [Planctomycetota bacterium]
MLELPFQLRPGDRIEASYDTGSSQLTLRNASWIDREAAYSSGSDLNLKVAADDDIHRLLQGWNALAFFKPAPGAARAKASLRLRINDRTWIRGRQVTTAAALEQFNSCVEVFRHVYDNTLSFHTGARIDRSAFEAEQRRLRQQKQIRTERGGW